MTVGAIVCVGALNVDRILSLREAAVLGTSNPASTFASPGGVARNVAEHLARRGVPTRLFGAVGDDPDGAFVLRECRHMGIDVSGVTVVSRPTGSYTAVIDADGSLVIGVSDMESTDALGGELVAGVVPSLAGAVWLMVDTNLPRPTLEALVAAGRSRDCRIAVNAVSVVKSSRAVGLDVDIVFCARDEAEAMTGGALGTPEDAADALRRLGFRSGVVTVGADGAWCFDESSVEHVPAQPTQVADATGAGDALVAETLRQLLAGRELADAVARGVGVSAAVIAHLGAGGDEEPSVQ